MKTGIRKSFEEHLKILISAKVFPENEGLEEWISERMEIHRIPSGHIVLGRYDGCRIRINERHLSDGGSILIVADVTELIQIEEQLRASKFDADTTRQKTENGTVSIALLKKWPNVRPSFKRLRFTC